MEGLESFPRRFPPSLEGGSWGGGWLPLTTEVPRCPRRGCGGNVWGKAGEVGSLWEEDDEDGDHGG